MSKKFSKEEKERRVQQRHLLRLSARLPKIIKLITDYGGMVGDVHLKQCHGYLRSAKQLAALPDARICRVDGNWTVWGAISLQETGT